MCGDHFGCHHWGGGRSWHLAGRSQGCCQIPYSAQDDHLHERIIWPKLPSVPSLRNPGHRSTAFPTCKGRSALFPHLSASLDKPLPTSRKSTNPVQPTLGCHAEVSLQWITAHASPWLRRTVTVCAQCKLGERGAEAEKADRCFLASQGRGATATDLDLGTSEC